MSIGQHVAFSAPLRGWTGTQNMLATYVVLPADAAQAVAAHELHQRILSGRRRGFGSVKVEVQLGNSRWSTSLFPQKDGSWFLPVKATVRRAEGLVEAETVSARLELL